MRYTYMGNSFLGKPITLSKKYKYVNVMIQCILCLACHYSVVFFCALWTVFICCGSWCFSVLHDSVLHLCLCVFNPRPVSWETRCLDLLYLLFSWNLILFESLCSCFLGACFLSALVSPVSMIKDFSKLYPLVWRLHPWCVGSPNQIPHNKYSIIISNISYDSL